MKTTAEEMDFSGTDNVANMEKSCDSVGKPDIFLKNQHWKLLALSLLQEQPTLSRPSPEWGEVPDSRQEHRLGGVMLGGHDPGATQTALSHGHHLLPAQYM